MPYYGDTIPALVDVARLILGELVDEALAKPLRIATFRRWSSMTMNEKPYLNILEESFPGIKQYITRCEALGRGISFETVMEAYGQDNERLLEFIRTYECPNKSWYLQKNNID